MKSRILTGLVMLLCAVAFMSTQTATTAVDQGQQIFRFDTFGDEQLWTDTLRMHEVIQSSVSPVTALGVGLKVDATALPTNFLATRDLNSPATTVELIKLNAVVGVVGTVRGTQLKSVGITCALCHSTVDNSVAPGIGNRLDGWPNRDLNPGAIIALSPALTSAQKAVYNSWGPGRFDPRFNVDGINGPVLILPAFGLKGVGFETYTGDRPISYWNNYVAVLEMGGHGSFSDPRLGISITQEPDLVTPKLPELLRYQLSLSAPPPPVGSSSVAGSPYVKVGETFTYSVTIVNGGANALPANEVVFNSYMTNGKFVSATSTQGKCRKSVNSDPVTVCDLGTIAVGKRVVISITVEAEATRMMDYNGEEVFITNNIIRGRDYDYTPENNVYSSRGTIIRR